MAETKPDVEIRIRCICPDPATHPDGDTITLPATLGFKSLAIATKALRWLKSEHPTAGVPEYLAELTEIYLLHCLGSWSLQERHKGKLVAIPLEPETVREYLMGPHPELALEVADRADELYQEAILSPLVGPARISSPDGASAEPISPTNGSSPKRRPRRSSISTIPTGSTAPMQ